MHYKGKETMNTETIKPSQIFTIDSALKEANISLSSFCRKYQIPAINQLPVELFEPAMAAINSYKNRKAKEYAESESQAALSKEQ
jgi:hypothetical protein